PAEPAFVVNVGGQRRGAVRGRGRTARGPPAAGRGAVRTQHVRRFRAPGRARPPEAPRRSLSPQSSTNVATPVVGSTTMASPVSYHGGRIVIVEPGVGSTSF